GRHIGASTGPFSVLVRRYAATICPYAGAMSWPRVASWVMALLVASVVITEAVAVAVAGNLGNRVYVGVAACVAITTTALGLLIAERRPTNLVAPLLCWMALVVALVSFSDTYLPMRTRHPALPDLPPVVVAILMVGWVWLYAAVSLLMLFFPDGRLPSPRWIYVAVGLPAVGLAIQVVMAVTPGPYDAPYARVAHPFGDLPSGVAVGFKVVLFPAIVALGIASVISLWTRYRRGDGARRAQVKWLALAALALPGTAILSWVGFLLTGTNNLAGVGFAVLYTAVPIATTIAILRHNLYDVDRVLSATVTYSAVTVVLLGVFGAASFAGGVVLGKDSVVAAAGATAITALALAPLRARLQRVADRRVYPLRSAALRAIRDLHTSISMGHAGPEHLDDVLKVALEDPDLRVGFRMPDDAGFVDANDEPVEFGIDAVPVMVSGHQIGAIHSHGPASEQLLHEVAAASGLLVEMVRLRLEVSAALREAESSRSRLLTLGYQERRRLERDLHDGAQQRLVTLGMSLRLAQRHLGDRTVDVDGLLDESVAQLGTAVAELREVAHGLRPSCLDDGLYPALSVLAESAALPIDLDIAADRAVPDEIATTAYYVVSEAIANAVKHADANRIGLRIEHDLDNLRVLIQDDGRGGASIRPGSGLAGLSDRVAAAGGTLFVRSAPGRGTLVEAMLPCAS
ncbi:MAG: putative two-component system histidine kinase, partial [Aeromicrobium sp.]|nr:putative two-component system histidine kinase [Aeromicrobium sp.]